MNRQPEPLNPARGILMALILGAVFWGGLVFLYLWSKAT